MSLEENRNSESVQENAENEYSESIEENPGEKIRDEIMEEISEENDSHEMEFKKEFSSEQWILTHIGDENLMEYLKMEQKKEEDIRKAKDGRQKRILSAFQLTVSLAAVITVIFLLRDNPTVMVNILYIIAIIVAFWIWKNPKQK